MKEEHRYRAPLTLRQRFCAIRGHCMEYIGSRWGCTPGIMFVEMQCTLCGFKWTTMRAFRDKKGETSTNPKETDND